MSNFRELVPEIDLAVQRFLWDVEWGHRAVDTAAGPV